MRIAVTGNHQAAAGLKEALSYPPTAADLEAYLVSEKSHPDFLVDIGACEGTHVVIDGIDSDFERRVVANLTEVLESHGVNDPIMLQRAGGVRSEKSISIKLPSTEFKYHQAAVYGVVRALAQIKKRAIPEPVKLPAEQVKPDPAHVKVLKWLGVLPLLLLSFEVGATEYTYNFVSGVKFKPLMTILFQTQPTGALPVKVSIFDGQNQSAMDNTNDAVRVNCIVGCGASGFTDNAAFTGGTTNVNPIAALYDTTPPTITDGSAGIPRMDVNRFLFVNCTVGCSGSSFPDDSAFTFGTTAISIGGFVVDDTATDPVAENSAGAPRMHPNRIIYTLDTNTTGTEKGTASLPLRVDPTGTTPQPVSATDLDIRNLAAAQDKIDVAQWNGVAQTAAAAAADNFANPTFPPIGAFNMVFDGTLWDRWTGGVTIQANASVNLAQWNGVAPTAAAAAADNFSNPTFPPIGAFNMLWDGATWDRWPGNSTDGAEVQVTVAGAGVDPREIEGQNNNRPIYCNDHAFLNMTTATTTQLVAISGSTVIYVCSYAFIANGTTTGKLVNGTGTNCATGTVDETPTWNLAAQAGINRTAGGGNTVLKTDAGDALCATNSAAINLQIEVSYAQF